MMRRSEKTSLNSTTFILLAVGLLVLTALAYIRGLDNAFTSEDFYLNLELQIPAGDLWGFIINLERFRPVYVTFYWSVLSVFGPSNPVGFHAVLLAVHLLNTILMLLIARQLTGNEKIGLVAALVYGVFPRHHQSLLWFAANVSLLVTVFGLFSLYTFLRYWRSRRIAWVILSIIGFALSGMSQESGILFVLFMMMSIWLIEPDYFTRKSLFRLRTYAPFIPYFVIALIVVGISFGGLELLRTASGIDYSALTTGREQYATQPPGPRTVIQFISYIAYLVFPFIPLRWLDPSNVPSLIVAGLALVIVALLLWKGNRLVRFGIAWAIFSVIPFVILVPFGNADRYFYTAAVGSALIVAALLVNSRLSEAAQLLPRAAAYAALFLWTAVSILLLQTRINEWRQAGVLATQAVDQFVTQYPNVVPDQTYVVLGLTDDYEQAYVYTAGGFGPAVLLRYGESSYSSRMFIYRNDSDSAHAYLEQAAVVENPITDPIVLFYRDGVFDDVTDRVSSVDQLEPGKWDRGYFEPGAKNWTN